MSMMGDGYQLSLRLSSVVGGGSLAFAFCGWLKPLAEGEEESALLQRGEEADRTHEPRRNEHARGGAATGAGVINEANLGVWRQIHNGLACAPRTESRPLTTQAAGPSLGEGTTGKEGWWWGSDPPNPARVEASAMRSHIGLKTPPHSALCLCCGVHGWRRVRTVPRQECPSVTSQTARIQR